MSDLQKDIVFHCDDEDESFVLEQHFDVAIPICFREIEGEPTLIECYPQIEELVRAHVTEWANNLFSIQSLKKLHQKMEPYIQKWGYEHDWYRMRVYNIYRAQKDSLFYMKNHLIGTRRLTEQDSLKNKTTQDIFYACRHGAIIYGHEENGEIVSIAATHLYDESMPYYAEVMVETAPYARKKGFAFDCLTALKEELFSRNYGIEYRCSQKNIASNKIAQKADLDFVGRCYYYVLRALR